MSSRYTYQRAGGNEITNAMKNPNNVESILVCTIAFIVVGLLMMVTGGVICLIYYTEITPPNFDANYHRYVGSSVPRIVGPLLISFGGLLTVGDVIIIGLTLQQYYKKKKEPADRPEITRTAIKSAISS